VREGKFIGTLGLKSYLKKMRASRITQEISNIILKKATYIIQASRAITAITTIAIAFKIAITTTNVIANDNGTSATKCIIVVYSTISKKSRMFFIKSNQIPNLPKHQECAHPTD